MVICCVNLNEISNLNYYETLYKLPHLQSKFVCLTVGNDFIFYRMWFFWQLGSGLLILSSRHFHSNSWVYEAAVYNAIKLRIITTFKSKFSYPTLYIKITKLSSNYEWKRKTKYSCTSMRTSFFPQVDKGMCGIYFGGRQRETRKKTPNT